MRHTWTTDQLGGMNRAMASGAYIEDYERDFSTRGVTAGSSVLHNDSKGTSATVSLVSSTRVTAAGILCEPGDFYHVTLPTPWMVQNSDGALIEVECNVCGFSYPAKELNKGRCKWCVDKPNRSK